MALFGEERGCGAQADQDMHPASDGWHESTWELMRGVEVREVWQAGSLPDLWGAVLRGAEGACSACQEAPCPSGGG